LSLLCLPLRCGQINSLHETFVFHSYSLITPNVLRVDSQEKIVVAAQGLSSQTDVLVTVQHFPEKRNILYRVTATLSKENGMLATPHLPIGPLPVLQAQYVLVQASCSQFTLEKVVLVAIHSGYIFIQTDKTIYTPGSPVRYRIFPVDHSLEPMKKPVIVEFEVRAIGVTQFGSCLSKNLNPSPSLNNDPLLPQFSFPSLGTWKIVAKYQDLPQQTFSTQFEVKEYVLPSFEVILEPSEKFFHIDDNKNFTVSITARFLYGENLVGVAFVLFGVKTDNAKMNIPNSLQRIQIDQGVGEAVLSRAMLQNQFQDLRELIGHSLYVSATVMTESGSDMVVTEKTDIRIVTTPYEIHFTKTTKYFKPGMPYAVMVYVTNPDGSPASNVPVTAELLEDRSQRDTATTWSDGTAKFTLNTLQNQKTLSVAVKTNHERLPDKQQANKTMVATAYETQGGSRNFLHISVQDTEVKAGDKLNIHFVLSNSQVSSTCITYIILNKGKILTAGRQSRTTGQSLVSFSLHITPDFIPSFRVVAYYEVGSTEIVADSILVDVKDTCMGKLVVEGATEADNNIHQPKDKVTIKLTGDANADVGLVAVDKGVYVLNQKHKLTQTKIWDTIEKSDIGCTAGSGRNNLAVFADAGLALVTNQQISTTVRSDPKCPQTAKRKKRSIQLIEVKASKVAQYEDRVLRKCCEDGMYDNPMGYSCEKRQEYILEDTACKNAFLECCLFIKSIRDEKQREEHLILARSDFEEEFLSEENIMSRTEFPESWLWQMEKLPPNSQGISSKTLTFYLKDSITTWEVLAVSMSDTKGICVSEPYEIRVMKDFFIDLRLPYSVVRNEQVEIRAILYNYASRDITVRVDLMHNPAICSASTARNKYSQIISIKAKSSRMMPFVIVPLQLGEYDLEVKAAVRGVFLADGVKKKLKVVVYGVQEVAIRSNDLGDIVPNTEPDTKISIIGNPVAEFTEYSVDGTKLDKLLIVPSGCVEQNLQKMTPTVIATHYLDSTGQWDKIGLERRTFAVQQIMKGYTQQLAYKKQDHSYPPYSGSKSSTWLTAYIAKVFAMASKLVSGIDHNVLCGSVKWLVLERLKPDGMFEEKAPVSSSAMTGGYRYGEPKVSLTAFVLITLLESRDICKKSIKMASNYINQYYESLKHPYTVALASYALALAGVLNSEEVLMRASTDRNRWEDNDGSIATEGTSYALLTLMKLKKFEDAGHVAEWLIGRNHYGATYGHTQSTIMVFQALAQYKIDLPSSRDQIMDVSFLLPQRSAPVTFRIDQKNSLLARTTETKLNEQFTVQARGQGEATVTVLTMYYAQLKEKKVVCNNFDLKVSVKEIELTIEMKICARYLGEIDAAMTMIDVSMLTGFIPDTEELKRLSEGVDKYITQFEIDNIKSEKGNLLLYLYKVSHTQDECLQFKAYKHFEVGFLQPGSVKIYSYYALDEQCTKFYHLSKDSAVFSKLCQGAVCQCANENCYKRYEADDPVNVQKRINEACKPGVDYVYKTRLNRTEEANGFIVYLMEALEVIKRGNNINPQSNILTFFSPIKCKDSLHLEENKDYLIWGLDSDMWSTKEGYSYFISKDTWIEKWPNNDECQDEEYQDLCNQFIEFSTVMNFFGCQA
uniref:Complement C3 n=1 Tax=Varanus komodoensis TaxID=61221 RepID=A0A8D2Q4D7_VARKO